MKAMLTVVGAVAALHGLLCGVLFHGDHDKVIDYRSTLRHKARLKPTDRLVVLPGARHNGMTDNPEYRREIVRLLE